MDCTTCKELRRQSESVPFIAHESALARLERQSKRLWIALILTLIMLVGSNVGWLIYESQIMEEYITQEIDTGDGTAVIAGIGDAIYGQDQADNQTQS